MATFSLIYIRRLFMADVLGLWKVNMAAAGIEPGPKRIVECAAHCTKTYPKGSGVNSEDINIRSSVAATGSPPVNQTERLMKEFCHMSWDTHCGL